jgi:hypothetical protein
VRPGFVSVANLGPDAVKGPPGGVGDPFTRTS